VTDQPGNGHFDPDDDEGLDDDTPLDPAEEAAAAAEALAQADESLDERVEGVVEDLDGVERRRDGGFVTYVFDGKPFAVLAPDALEVALDAAVARAALKTPGSSVSRRGPGWIVFTPKVVDRFALDRAEAWLRSAYQRAAGS
jgi:hypothetical protein